MRTRLNTSVDADLTDEFISSSIPIKLFGGNVSDSQWERFRRLCQQYIHCKFKGIKIYGRRLGPSTQYTYSYKEVGVPVTADLTKTWADKLCLFTDGYTTANLDIPQMVPDIKENLKNVKHLILKNKFQQLVRYDIPSYQNQWFYAGFNPYNTIASIGTTGSQPGTGLSMVEFQIAYLYNQVSASAPFLANAVAHPTPQYLYLTGYEIPDPTGPSAALINVDTLHFAQVEVYTYWRFEFYGPRTFATAL